MSEEYKVSAFYTVRYRPYDGGGEKGSLFCSVLKEFLEGGRTVNGNVKRVEDGCEVRIRYKIGSGCLCWKKTCARRVLEEAFRRRDGRFCLVTHNFSGELVSEAVFDGSLKWLQTAYFSGGSAKPSAVIRPTQEGMILLTLNEESGKYIRRALLPCPLHEGSVLQSYSNSAAGGEPEICAQTDAGDYCYCPPEEWRLRLAALRSAEGDALRPRWPEEPDAELDFRYVPNDVQAPAQPPAREEEPPAASDYAADREIFSIAGPEPEPEAKKSPPPAKEKGGAQPSKYAVAAKGLSGGVVRAERLKRKSEPPLEQLVPAKRIVVSSMESYLYFGEIIDGLRQGQGRTQMANGHTAYEGGYRNDRRDGFGVYYYKSGKICYVGGWKQNLRDGMGIAFGSRDGSIFVGNWKDNIPTGKGSSFDMEGNLTYTGEWKDGKRNGHGTEYAGGRVLRVGEWRDDCFCSGYEYVAGKPVPFGSDSHAVD